MRLTLAVFACLLITVFSVPLNAQKANEAEVLSIAEKMPEYPGGIDSLMKEVVSNLVYPKQCADSGIQGKVYLRFIVNEAGGISNVEAIKGPHPLLNTAAIEAAKTISKKFTPATDKGKAVKVWYSLPVSFKVKVVEPTPEPVITEREEPKIFTFVEVQPEFPGGDGELMNFLRKNINYPIYDRDNDIQGKVLLRFVLDIDGSVTDVQVVKGVSPGLDKEAVRVVSLLPKFKPGMQDGKPVKVYFNLPLVFKLENGGYDPRAKTLFDYYPGDHKAFINEVYKNMHYPPKAQAEKLEAVIYVKCKINNNLKFEPIQIINSLDSGFNQEAIRLMEIMTPFKSDIKTTKFFNEVHEVSITFTFDPRHRVYGSAKYSDERNANDYYYKGAEYYENGDYKTALQYFNNAIRDYSLHAKAFFNCGVTYLKLNDPIRACESFKRAYLLGGMDAMKGIKEACK